MWLIQCFSLFLNNNNNAHLLYYITLKFLLSCTPMQLIFIVDTSPDEISVTVDGVSASWTYDATIKVLDGISFKVTKVSLYNILIVWM